MTAQRDLKRIVRERQQKTGESYTAARAHVMRDRVAVAATEATEVVYPRRLEAAVLKLNQQSARVRILADSAQLTFRSGDVYGVVPGQIVTLVVEKRWTWRGDEYASGRIENPRIDIAKLALEPLPLEGGELEDAAARIDPYTRPDPYAPLWMKLTAKPRRSFEMDGIAWGAFPDAEPDENPTCDAAELAEEGDLLGAHELMMDVLLRELRCIDAHAHLGNWAFDRSPTRALLHYEIGLRIGELSLPAGFDGMLPWGEIHNRPFLRCLHGYGVCLWRLGRVAEAERVFERLLSLNPNDHQGVRYCWQDVREGRAWEADA